jgi:hypothetical protein
MTKTKGHAGFPTKNGTTNLSGKGRANNLPKPKSK